MISKKLLGYVYLILSVIGLVMCMRETLHYSTLGLGYIDANIKFWNDTFVNSASRSISWDIIIMYFSASIFIISESKRLKLRYSWVFVIGGYLSAIAFTFPLFLFFRNKKI